MRIVSIATAAAAGLALVGLVGVVDSALTASIDHLVLFSAALVLSLVLLVLARSGRAAAVLRPDLARWVNERATRTGEAPSALVDRAVASYRAGVTPPPADGDPRSATHGPADAEQGQGQAQGQGQGQEGPAWRPR